MPLAYKYSSKSIGYIVIVYSKPVGTPLDFFLLHPLKPIREPVAIISYLPSIINGLIADLALAHSWISSKIMTVSFGTNLAVGIAADKSLTISFTTKSWSNIFLVMYYP